MTTSFSADRFTHTSDASSIRSTPDGVDITFHKQALASASGRTRDFMLAESLLDTMDRLGHKHLSVLKIDIEGSEWDVFDSLLNASDAGSLPFDQLLIELHYQDNLAQVFRFFEVDSTDRLVLWAHFMYLSGAGAGRVSNLLA